MIDAFPTEAKPAEGFAIDQPEFKATAPKLSLHGGELWEIVTCFEWSGEKWEGFVSMRRFGGKKRRMQPTPAPLAKVEG